MTCQFARLNGDFTAIVLNAIQNDQIDQALKKLDATIRRTDGCVLRGAPDGNGRDRDWIIDCDEQAAIYASLIATRDALIASQ